MDKTTSNRNTTRHELGGLESFSRAIALAASALFPLLRISSLVSAHIP